MILPHPIRATPMRSLGAVPPSFPRIRPGRIIGATANADVVAIPLRIWRRLLFLGEIISISTLFFRFSLGLLGLDVGASAGWADI